MHQNNRFPFPFIYFNLWNPYPFIVSYTWRLKKVPLLSLVLRAVRYFGSFATLCQLAVPDPHLEIRGGPVSKKHFLALWLFGPQFGLKIRVGPPLDLPFVSINLHWLKELTGCVTKVLSQNCHQTGWNMKKNPMLKTSKEGINSTANTKGSALDGPMWRSQWRMGLKWIALWFLKTCLAKQFYKVHFLLFVTSATQ